MRRRCRCTTCHEKYPGMPMHSGAGNERDGGLCVRCHKNPVKFSSANNMEPWVNAHGAPERRPPSEVREAVDFKHATDAFACAEPEGTDFELLPELTQAEQSLIALAHQHIQVYRCTGGGLKYRGHVCFFPQKVRRRALCCVARCARALAVAVVVRIRPGR